MTTKTTNPLSTVVVILMYRYPQRIRLCRRRSSSGLGLRPCCNFPMQTTPMRYSQASGTVHVFLAGSCTAVPCVRVVWPFSEIATLGDRPQSARRNTPGTRFRHLCRTYRSDSSADIQYFLFGSARMRLCNDGHLGRDSAPFAIRNRVFSIIACSASRSMPERRICWFADNLVKPPLF